MFIKGQSSQFVLSFAYFYLLLSMQLNVDQRIVIFDLTSIQTEELSLYQTTKF